MKNQGTRGLVVTRSIRSNDHPRSIPVVRSLHIVRTVERGTPIKKRKWTDVRWVFPYLSYFSARRIYQLAVSSNPRTLRISTHEWFRPALAPCAACASQQTEPSSRWGCRRVRGPPSSSLNRLLQPSFNIFCYYLYSFVSQMTSQFYIWVQINK